MKYEKSKIISGILFILPAGIVYGVFALFPVVQTSMLSFYKWDGAQPIKLFVGFKNYARAVHDPILWLALRNNVVWVLLSVTLPVGVGLMLALLLSKKPWGNLLFRISYFMPCIMSLIVVGIIWGWIYHPMIGIINVTLRAVRLDMWARGWLGDPVWALPSLIIAGAWTYYGFTMIIFLAGLQNIDPILYEAAKIDGANAFQSFLHITIPGLRPVITLILCYTMIGSFKVFDLVYVTTKGGPFNKTEVLSMYIYYNAFRTSEIGYASSIAIILSAIVITLVAIFLFLRER